jgi:3-oxoacyl-[acyl-carrier protein] reductase
MRRLEGKTAMITGSNRGMGLAILKLFVSEGANVIACCRTKTEETESLFSSLAAEHAVTVTPVYFDMSDEESVKAGIKEIKALKTPLQILVNNAGIPHLAILPFTKMADAHQVFQVNYFAPMQLIQGLQGLLGKGKPASIVNMASIAGLNGDPGNSVYGASKAALILLTKVVAKEFAPMGIRCNAVAPGLTETDFAEKMGEKAKESMIQTSAMHRLGTPDEVAKAVLYLASDESSFVNGEVIRVDGGY